MCLSNVYFISPSVQFHLDSDHLIITICDHIRLLLRRRSNLSLSSLQDRQLLLQIRISNVSSLVVGHCGCHIRGIIATSRCDVLWLDMIVDKILTCSIISLIEYLFHILNDLNISEVWIGDLLEISYHPVHCQLFVRQEVVTDIVEYQRWRTRLVHLGCLLIHLWMRTTK